MTLGVQGVCLSAATEAIERGWCPDPAVRWGIRQLCAQRLREQAALLDHDRGARDRFIARLQAAEIAPVPEKANAQHYEVPAEFFRLMLGPRLKYSCCWWDQSVGSLAAAEDASLRLTANHAQIEDGMRILELGCGWGSLTLWLAEHYPRCTIVSVSNSASQRAFIAGAARERGLANVSVVTADMNVFDLEQRFDRVVSVEMFEHMRNHAALLARIARWLEADGRLFVHVFCHRQFTYAFEADGAQNWMGRHFFSGGLMPSADLLPSLPSPFAVEEQWRWPGMHYARTAEAWLANVDARSEEVRHALERAYGPAAASRWLQRLRMFLMACAELFVYAAGAEWGVGHYRFRLEP
jgi:cyclopropane-fatty-acyl-phospholipid synthase